MDCLAAAPPCARPAEHPDSMWCKPSTHLCLVRTQKSGGCHTDGRSRSHSGAPNALPHQHTMARAPPCITTLRQPPSPPPSRIVHSHQRQRRATQTHVSPWLPTAWQPSTLPLMVPPEQGPMHLAAPGALISVRSNSDAAERMHGPEVTGGVLGLLDMACVALLAHC